MSPPPDSKGEQKSDELSLVDMKELLTVIHSNDGETPGKDGPPPLVTTNVSATVKRQDSQRTIPMGTASISPNSLERSASSFGSNAGLGGEAVSNGEAPHEPKTGFQKIIAFLEEATDIQKFLLACGIAAVLSVAFVVPLFLYLDPTFLITNVSDLPDYFMHGLIIIFAFACVVAGALWGIEQCRVPKELNKGVPSAIEGKSHERTMLSQNVVASPSHKHGENQVSDRDTGIPVLDYKK